MHDDIKELTATMRAALASDNEAAATVATMRLVETALIDLRRIADALERIANKVCV